ncbi:MAG: hypothetical protein HGB05_14545 [Chloroflexi bacterium]|nr:hypothetical protein [Chloroflexota bacterium]
MAEGVVATKDELIAGAAVITDKGAAAVVMDAKAEAPKVEAPKAAEAKPAEGEAKAA